MWICPKKMIMEFYPLCVHWMNLSLFKSKSSKYIQLFYLSLFSTVDDSRMLLYYASPETSVSPKEQNDLYGHLIEKKRVSVQNCLTLSNALP
jgi:hypothetical protein